MSDWKILIEGHESEYRFYTVGDKKYEQNIFVTFKGYDLEEVEADAPLYQQLEPKLKECKTIEEAKDTADIWKEIRTQNES